MSRKVMKPVVWNNQEFVGYEIIGIEWLFRGDIFYVLTDYFFKSATQNTKRLVKHQFEVGNEVNVDEMINMVHKMHE